MTHYIVFSLDGETEADFIDPIPVPDYAWSRWNGSVFENGMDFESGPVKMNIGGYLYMKIIEDGEELIGWTLIGGTVYALTIGDRLRFPAGVIRATLSG